MHTFVPVFLAALAAAILSTTPAQAQTLNTKSFVASTGDNTNTCATEALPCRTLTGALGKTGSGGIITCLDGGEFSGGATTTITKSITIDCAGTGASVFFGAATIVVAAGAQDTIHIRGLKIRSNNRPIYISGTGAASAIRVEDCDLTGGANAGIDLDAVAGTNLLSLLVVNTTIASANTGMKLAPNGGAAKITLHNVRIFDSFVDGIRVTGTNATTSPGLRVVVKNSTITRNNGQGILAQSTGGITRIFVEDSVIAQNGSFGLQADGVAADFIVSRSTITHNTTGLSAINGGRLFTYGNNGIHGNVSGSGAFTGLIPLQ